jgi:hypothetical protein
MRPEELESEQVFDRQRDEVATVTKVATTNTLGYGFVCLEYDSGGELHVGYTEFGFNLEGRFALAEESKMTPPT